MLLDLAKMKVQTNSQILVLGNPAVSQIMKPQLEELGFGVTLQQECASPLTSQYSRSASDQLRALFSEFIARTPFPEGTSGMRCVHPGTSPWADRAILSTLAQKMGLAVVSPPVRVVSLFANKLSLLYEAEKLGIPHLVIRFDALHTVREVVQLVGSSQEAGKGTVFPFVLRSAWAVGPGAEHRVIYHPKDIEAELPFWIEQLRSKCGEAILFAEQYLDGARYFRVPFVRFRGGFFKTFPLIDSSLQSRYRRMVDFCPALQLDPAVEKNLQLWTQRLADGVGYIGVGMLDFLVDGSRAYLVNGLARLDFAYPLWEKISGTSAMRWQLEAVQNSKPSNELIHPNKKSWGIGMGLHLYAEDSSFQVPQPGTLQEISQRRRWELEDYECNLSMAVEEGNTLPPEGDSLLGMFVALGQNHRQLLENTHRALEDFWMGGSLQANDRFLRELIRHPWVKEGIFHAGFVDEDFVPSTLPPSDWIPAFASLCATLAEESHEIAEWVVGNTKVAIAKISELKWESPRKVWSQDGRTGFSGTIVLSNKLARACVFPLEDDFWQVRLGEWSRAVRAVRKGIPRKVFLYSQLQGRVHSLLFLKDREVDAHEPLVVIESLGTFVPHALPVKVKILDWFIQPQQRVMKGQRLAELSRVNGESEAEISLKDPVKDHLKDHKT